MARVTIIIPTYKRAVLLRRTLNSFVNQTFSDFEIVVVSDNWPDDSEEFQGTIDVINTLQDSRIKYASNFTNLGHPNIFKKCFSFPLKQYFMLFGDDDELLPESLQKLVDYLDENPDVSLAHGLDIFVDETGKTSYERSQYSTTAKFLADDYLHSLLNQNGKRSVSLSAALFRSDVIAYNDIRLYGTYQWDVYFFAQLFLYTKKIGYINEHLDRRYAAVHHTGKDGSDLYLFYIQVENLYLILKFITDFQFALASKQINASKIQFVLGWRLLNQFMHLKEFSRSVFCLSIGLKAIGVASMKLVLWGIAKPIALVIGKLNAVRNVVKLKA